MNRPSATGAPTGMGNLAREIDLLLASQPDVEGLVPTGIEPLSIFQARECFHPQKVLYKPVLCLVVQGAKRIRVGDIDYDFEEGQSLVVDLDLPLQSTILIGSRERPYRALSLELDPLLFQEVAGLMPRPPVPIESEGPAVSIQGPDPVFVETLQRLLRLARTPEAVPILLPAILRELVFHLLSGANGPAFARLAFPTTHTRRVAEAVRELRRNLSQSVGIPGLAASVGMSPSTFHQRFKELTASTPLQFQKQLRLLEARRLMLTEGLSASEASRRVGYRSDSQFSREYARHFGAPPRREVTATRSTARS